MVSPHSSLCRIMILVGRIVSQNHFFSEISLDSAPQISLSISNSTSTLIFIIGLGVNGSCVFGLKDSTEQGPVDGPRLDGFGAVGTAARHALLAEVNLPAAEIGGGWFHGLVVGG